MKDIYLDNSATTPLCNAAKDAMYQAMELYGNPSSLHSVGQTARALVEDARRELARTMGIRGTQGVGRIIFTSCGSESDNIAVCGTAYAKPRRRGGRIITTDSEHPGVESAMRVLACNGFDIVRISTRGGELDWEQYEAALNDRTFLVSIMMVNNETGAMYDVGRAFSMAKAKDPDIVTHTDAVQGYLKCRFTPQALHADLVTVSAHKIHGPKGVGALYASADAIRRKDFEGVILGGGQEQGFRSGTENVIGIAGFGAAAKEGFANLTDDLAYLTELRDYARERLASLSLQFNVPKGTCAPHILNVTLPNIRSETVLHALSADGISVSHGSACSSHSSHVSPSLLAFGLTPEQAECSIRISFGKQNTREDVDALVDSLSRAIDRLVRVKR